MTEDELLRPTYFVDSDHPDVIAFAARAVGGAEGDRERASRLFRAVRDELRYDPYTLTLARDDYRASAITRLDRTFCVPKAILLCAVARASGIRARLGFADVKNHLSSEKLLRTLGTDLFVFHGYVELWIEGHPYKASPAFNTELCARFGVPPLEFDGTGDALLQPYDGEGRRMMEYVRDRGLHLDLPFDEMMRVIAQTYGGGKARPVERDDAFEP